MEIALNELSQHKVNMKNNQHQQNLKLKSRSSSFFKQTNDRYTQVLVCKEINVWCPTLNKTFIIPLQIYICVIE